MYTLLFVTIGVIVLSALCSLLEAVLYSVPMRYVEANVEKGKKIWRLFKKFRIEVDKSIAAIVSLNTIANTFGATVVGSLGLIYLGERYIGIIGVVLTALILIFGEIIPKTLGVIFGKRLCPYTTYLLIPVRYLMLPFVWLISGLTGILTKRSPPETVSPDEIRVLARMGALSGGLVGFESKVIEGILSLRSKRVKDVMTPRTVLFTLPADLTLGDIMNLEERWEHSRVPIYKGSKEEVVGIVLTKELFIALAKGKRDLTLADFARPVSFISELTKLDTALVEFLKTRQQIFVVLDEFGGVSGVITLEDIIEEILGEEIVDESDLVIDKRQWAKKIAKKIMFKS